jgi:hypothetical protein
VVVVGPGIGGLLLLTGRPVIGVAVNAASFVIAAAVIARLRVRSTGGAAADGNALQQLAVGLKALAAQPVALAIILFCALDSAVYGASTVLYVPLSIQLGTGPNRLQLPAGRRRARRSARRRPGKPAQRRRPPGPGHHGKHLPPSAAVPGDRPGPIPCAGLHPAGCLGRWDDHRGRVGHHQPAADLHADVLSRVLGIFDTIVLGGILLASLATGILLAHADVNVALIAIGVGIPAMG